MDMLEVEGKDEDKIHIAQQDRQRGEHHASRGISFFCEWIVVSAKKENSS
jgi:hypothetical protein